jgi:hypothetical protein
MRRYSAARNGKRRSKTQGSTGKDPNFATQEAGIAETDIRFTGLLVLYNNMLQSLFKSQ